MPDVLQLERLRIRAGDRVLVHDAALRLEAGGLVALVGASGSGKTLTCRALIGMVDLSPGVESAGLEIRVGDRVHRPYDGLSGADRRARDRAFAALRGGVVGYLPQDAPASLEPLWRVGRQVVGAARLAGEPTARPEPFLVRAGFDPDEAHRVAGCWPHQLSGGMAQRVAIAQALARGSRFLLADEPTTGLDAPVQVHLMRELRALADRGLGVLLVTHDLARAAPFADRVLLMDGGRLVEDLGSDPLGPTTPTTEAGRRLVDASRPAFGGAT